MLSVPPINLIKLRQGFIIERMFPLGVQFVVSVGISAPGISLRRRDIIVYTFVMYMSYVVVS